MKDKIEEAEQEAVVKKKRIYDWLAKALEDDRNWQISDSGIIRHKSEQIRIRTYDQIIQEPITLEPPRNIRSQIRKLSRLLKQKRTNNHLQFLIDLFENDFESSICVDIAGSDEIRTKKIKEMQQWLKENLSDNYSYRVSRYGDRITIFFHDPTDAMAFKLIWC